MIASGLRAALLAALPVVAAGAAAAEVCIVADPTGTPLNLRAVPNGGILGTLANGTGVSVEGRVSVEGKPWLRVRGPAGSGWVVARYLDCTPPAPPGAGAFCRVADPSGTPLNLRDAPDGAVIGTLGNGTAVTVGPAEGRWARIARPDGRPLGWAFRRYLDCAQAPPRAPAEPAPAARAEPRLAPPAIQAPPKAASGPAAPPALAAALPERRVALLVGNGAYGTVAPLTNPGRDAAALAEALRGLGFRTVTLRENLGSEGMRQALRAFAAEAADADWAVVYYAGHDLEMGGVNYLVPVDARLKSDRDVPFEAVPLDQVLASVEGARKLQLVILDACRDNPFAAAMKRTAATRAIGRGLARIEPEGSQLVAFAAKAGQTASDGAEGAGNSPFMTSLVKHLAVPGTEIRKLFGLVRDDVLARTGRAQEPAIYGSLGGADYVFHPAP